MLGAWARTVTVKTEGGGEREGYLDGTIERCGNGLCGARAEESRVLLRCSEVQTVGRWAWMWGWGRAAQG